MSEVNLFEREDTSRTQHRPNSHLMDLVEKISQEVLRDQTSLENIITSLNTAGASSSEPFQDRDDKNVLIQDNEKTEFDSKGCDPGIEEPISQTIGKFLSSFKCKTNYQTVNILFTCFTWQKIRVLNRQVRR